MRTSVSIQYKMPNVSGMKVAAQRARDRMLSEWSPVHWHLDYVGMSIERHDTNIDQIINVTFSAVLPDSSFESGDFEEEGGSWEDREDLHTQP